MMTSRAIRQKFLDFFESKKHKIVPSAPLVNKDDPTLMFINAGMNQFKDYFLGNKTPDNPRIADTQKCLRVSGKQNDLEEVGIDSYHHTLFEMLGNWSIGDYHVDLRSDEERQKVSGATLVNMDHPQVIEIWNLVFIQFNRKADGSLEKLPNAHIDTGMGFERLCMALQGKKSNYDTDIFTPFINKISELSGKPYTGSYELTAKSDIAMRVVADHLRAVSFAVADGQMMSSNGAGYVIRRILRRAVRYYYSFLEVKEPLIHQLVPMLADEFSDVFPELKAQQDQVAKIILGEEKSFLKTLEGGLKRIENL